MLIEADADRNILVANGVEIARGVGIAKDDFHVRSGKRCLHLLQRYLLLVLDCDRKGMTMEDGHMNQL